MSGEARAANFEYHNDSFRSQCVDPISRVVFSGFNGARRDSEELQKILFDACSPSPEEGHVNLMSQIRAQLNGISNKNVSDIEKLQEKEKILEHAIDILGAQNEDLVATVSILKQEAEQRMIELDKHLDRTAHATKDMVVNLSNWGQEIEDLIVLKYQAEDAIKESQMKASLLMAENTALKDQNANLLHDIQSLLQIIRQARTTGHWEMECVTFCEIVPEDVYGPVCGMSLKQSFDSSDWADMHRCDKPESPQYAASEKSSFIASWNGSTSHCLNNEAWMQPSELHASFEAQRLERKLVECQLEILEKDKIIADLESQITSLNYEMTVKNADCEGHLSALYWYQEVLKARRTCPEMSLLGSLIPGKVEVLSNRPHLVNSSTQADFSSAPKDQLCFAPYTESCPALNTIEQEDHNLNQPHDLHQQGTDVVDIESDMARICQPTSKLSAATNCSGSPPGHSYGVAPYTCPLCRQSQQKAEGTENLYEASSEQLQKPDAQTEQARMTLAETRTDITIQGDISPLLRSFQAPLHQQCCLAHEEGPSASSDRMHILQTSPSSPLQSSSFSEKPSSLSNTSPYATDSALEDVKRDASNPTDRGAGNSCQAWTVSIAPDGGALGAAHKDITHHLNRGSTRMPPNLQQHKSDSVTQTECSFVAMGIQTDFRLECSLLNGSNVKNQEVESLKERLSHMEEKVSSKNILLSQLQTHLETACREVELKDRALANVEKKLELSRHQCDALKNDLNVLESKAKGLEEQVEALLKIQEDMEDKMQRMNATEQELHKQKRSLLVQLDSAAEESVMHKDEAQILRKQLDLKKTEVEHQYATICNLQEALLLSKSALESVQQQMIDTKVQSYASNGRIHNI